MNETEIDQALLSAEQTLQQATQGGMSAGPTPEQLAPLVDQVVRMRVSQALQNIPVLPGPPGDPGRDGPAPEEVAELVKAEVAKIPTPKDGRDGKDGRPGLPGRKIERVISMPDYERLLRPDGAAQVAFTPSGSGLTETTVAGVIEELATEGSSGGIWQKTGTNVYNLNPALNEVDSQAQGAFQSGPGLAGFPNYIGKNNVVPAGTDFDPGWGETGDTTYAAGGAQLASIHGSYDGIVNSIASAIINCPHAMISEGSGGHHKALGGSYVFIDGASTRSAVAFARNAGIADASSFGLVLGGDNQRQSGTGAHKTIVNGSANSISSTGSYNALFNVKSGTISGTQSYGGSFCGDTITVTGLGSINIGGARNTNAERAAVTMGEDAIAYVPNGLHISRTALREAGDCQAIVWASGVVTTGNTITNLLTSGTDNLQLPAGKVASGSGKVWLTGMLDGSADGNNDAVYTRVMYEAEFGFSWDGTNGHLFKSGTETTVTGSPTLDMNLISQTNNDFTAGAAAQVRVSTGLLRAAVTGIAATRIVWNATWIAGITVVS